MAEFKSLIGTREYGNMLVSVATEYNNAMLVVENANIGWSTIQTIIDRNYTNLYYSPKSDMVNVDSYLQDDGLGNIQIVTSDLVNPKIVKPIAGNVNYETGEINLVGFKTEGYAGSGIRIMVTTANDDITSPAGRIFLIDDNDVTVNMIEVK